MYRRVSYAPAPVFSGLLTAVKNLLSPDADESVFQSKIADPRNIKDDDISRLRTAIGIVLDGFISQYGSFYFTDSSQLCNIDSKVRTLFIEYFNRSKRVADPENIPVRLKKYLRHTITINELMESFIVDKVDYMLLPGFDEVPNRIGKVIRPPLKRDAIQSHLVQACLSVISAASLIPSYIDVVKDYTNHVLYNIKSEKPLNQFDKTLLTNCLCPDFGMNVSFSPAENANFDINAVEEFEEIKKHIESTYLPGPYSSVAGIVSTGGLASPFLFVGAYTPELLLIQGRITPFFRVFTSNLKCVDIIPWKAENLIKYQMLSDISETVLSTNFDSIRHGATMIGNVPPLDEPDVRYSLDRFKERLVAKYYSKLHSREMIATSPQPYWIEKYATEQIEKGSAVGLQSIDTFRTLDIELINNELISTERSIDVWVLRKKNGKFTPSLEKVNLRSMLPGGNIFVRPLISEAFAVDTNDLLVENPTFVSLTQGQLSLSEDEVNQSKHILAVQYNAYKYRVLFGSTQDLTSEQKTLSLVKSLHPSAATISDKS